METAEAKTIKDFIKGPVYDETLQRYLVEIRYPDGRRVRKRFRRERSAMRWWTSEQVRIDDGTWDETSPKVITVGKAFKIYRAHAELHHRSYKTYTKPQLGLLEKLLGADTTLSTITVQRVEEIQAARAAERSNSTADHTLTVLKAAFNFLIERGHANFNPVAKVKFFHPNNERVRWLSDDERERLLLAAAEGPEYLSDAIEVAENTGLRRTNVLLLRKDECNFQTRMIRKTATKNNDTLSVPMTDRVWEVLKRRAAKFPGSEYFFPHAEGSHAGEAIRDLKKSFATALEVAEITAFRWHDLRHSFGSRLAMAGVDLVSIQRLLGHKSLRMTSRYAHVSDEHLANQVKILDKTLPKICPRSASKSDKMTQKRARQHKQPKSQTRS
ncbi:MAG: tyrosine-type recombinase/integrase [Terriglobia bacterium]